MKAEGGMKEPRYFILHPSYFILFKSLEFPPIHILFTCNETLAVSSYRIKLLTTQHDPMPVTTTATVHSRFQNSASRLFLPEMVEIVVVTEIAGAEIGRFDCFEG